MTREYFISVGDLPKTKLFDADLEENPIIYCDRCKCEHVRHTYTKQDEEKIIRELSRQLAEEIDREILAELMATTFRKV